MRVFLSHSSSDERFAGELREKLVARSVDVWNPRIELMPGSNWLLETGRAFERADGVVFLFSEASAQSPWLKKEVEYGRVIPLRRKTCIAKDLAWPLATIQMISAQPYADGVRRLLALWDLRYREK